MPYSVCDTCGGYQWGVPINSGHKPCDCGTIETSAVEPFSEQDNIMEIEENGQKYYYSQAIEEMVKKFRYEKS